MSETQMIHTDRTNQPEDFQLVAQEREMERVVKDVVDARNIGIADEAQKAADATDDGSGSGKDDPKNHREKSETVTIPKGFRLQLRDNLTVVILKDTEVEVMNARSKGAIAGELAVYPELYGAVRDSLAHTEKEDLPDGNTVHRKIEFGSGGVRMVTEETVKTKQGVVDTTPAPGLEASVEGNQGTEARLAAAEKDNDPQAADKAAADKQAAADKKTIENEQKLAKSANDVKSPAADKAKADAKSDSKTDSKTDGKTDKK